MARAGAQTIVAPHRSCWPTTRLRNARAASSIYLPQTGLFLQPLTSKTTSRSCFQIYFDRWQIEVNHREEKRHPGRRTTQLWNPTSVPKQPVLVVAAYSALLLAALIAFGPKRNDAYAQLPKWRRKAQRPSCLDLVTLLRKEVDEHPEILTALNINASRQQLAATAAA